MSRRRTTGRAAAAKKREAHWRRIMAKQRRSGLTHTEFCGRESISVHSYFWWKRELGVRAKKRGRSVPQVRQQGEKKPATSLVPVTIKQAAIPAASDWFEVLLSSGRVLRVRSGFDAESLKRLVAILEED